MHLLCHTLPLTMHCILVHVHAKQCPLKQVTSLMLCVYRKRIPEYLFCQDFPIVTSMVYTYSGPL